MNETILFITGQLAESALHRVLENMKSRQFDYRVHNLGIKVAGLMTTEMLLRRLPLSSLQDVSRVMVPGRCRGSLETVSAHFGIPFLRGPVELKDLPKFFGHAAGPPSLDGFDVEIFAEIVDAPLMSLEALIRAAGDLVRDGADVVDLGCLPETPFPLLEQAIAAFHERSWRVSVDSSLSDELVRGNRAGADYLLSLKPDTLWIADHGPAIPILIPDPPQSLESLQQSMQVMEERQRAYFADPILDPIHFGFVDSIVRFHQLRQKWPHSALFMGTGNLTELTDADTSGIHGILLGMVSELNVRAILTTQVSAHCRRAVKEVDAARRMFYAARQLQSLPRDFSDALLTVHERDPFPNSSQEVDDLAAQIKDVNYRVQVTPEGVHLYNRDHHLQGQEPFAFFPQLTLKADTGHAFYLGVELARAQLAWQLGKRYEQDEQLSWGCATDKVEVDLEAPHALRGATWNKTS